MNNLLNTAALLVLNGTSSKVLQSEESFDAGVPEHSAVRRDRATYLHHRAGLIVGERVVFGQRSVELVMQLLGPSACLVRHCEYGQRFAAFSYSLVVQRAVHC